MKFAKTLEDLMVPEWRTQYVHYKTGKQRVKITANRLRNAQSPAVSALRLTASRISVADGASPTAHRGLSKLRKSSSGQPRSQPDLQQRPSIPTLTIATPASVLSRQQPETIPEQRRLSTPTIDYGSSGVTPGFTSQPINPEPDISETQKPPSLLLPDGTKISISLPFHEALNPLSTEFHLPPFELSKNPVLRPYRPPFPQIEFTPRPLLQRLFTLGSAPITDSSGHRPTFQQVQAEAEKEFLKWLIGELHKCESFYSSREMVAIKRFDELREQLDVMRDRWFKTKHNLPFEESDVADVAASEILQSTANRDSDAVSAVTAPSAAATPRSAPKKKVGWKSIADAMNGLTRPNPTTALMDITAGFDEERDYTRRRPTRKPLNNPDHRIAKRKLKKAYVEYYHGLEMLKSYVTVNRECFRKITKKFDKASGLRTSRRFMTGYVDQCQFGRADNQLDNLLNDTEALFARFFERSNRKQASSTLRQRENKALYYSSVGKSGFYLGGALILTTYALYNAVTKQLNTGDDPILSIRTGYLLQLWGGVALVLLQALLFSVNLRVWAKNKINYAFIFEFNPRHMLNYRQFLEFPAMLSLIFAICFWLSSNDFWNGRLDMIYFPAIYVCITATLLFNPLRMCYFHSRKWLLTTLGRLMLSGVFPVEFKDFWMGDMLCSQTYALGNIELFFCLYWHKWNNPPQCNSSNSRMMGFFTALPGILRLIQCIRRYHNSGIWFPHLVNGGKYMFTILHYVTLSMWRMNFTNSRAKAAFIACAAINSCYCVIWDVAMDWSLLDLYAKHPFLRKHLGFKRAWPYYVALFLDPLFRFNWLFYILYAEKIQHSAMLSFGLALAEVLRRFMWCFFRMENEHVGNVGANRAYRDPPLPYQFSQVMGAESPEEQQHEVLEDAELTSHSTSTDYSHDIERMDSPRHRFTRPDLSTPMIRTITKVGRTMNQAHLQDYERKRNRQEEEVEFSSDEEEDGEDYYERTRESILGNPGDFGCIGSSSGNGNGNGNGGSSNVAGIGSGLFGPLGINYFSRAESVASSAVK